MELFRNQNMRIQETASGDPACAKIELLNGYPLAARAVQRLIEQSMTDDQAAEQPLIFAGQHRGMPSTHVWAFTRYGEAASSYLEQIATAVEAAIAEVSPMSTPHGSALQRPAA